MNTRNAFVSRSSITNAESASYLRELTNVLISKNHNNSYHEHSSKMLQFFV